MARKAAQAGARGRGVLGDPSRMRAERTRKVFARASLDSLRTYISGAAIEQVLANDFIDGLKLRCQGIFETEQEFLEQLFLVGRNNNYTALLPSDDHPGKPLRSWQPFYELEMDTAQTYACRFFGDTRFCPVRGYLQLRPSDDVVVIGSQVSNLAARDLLGEADQAEPVFHIARGGWRTELHWNLLTPQSAPRTTIREFGGLRESFGHVICERGSSVCYQSEADPARTRYLDDYLLVTTLPRTKGGKQRATIFAGLHGAGARAVDLILREPPTNELEKAAHQIAGAPYFQMLWHLECMPDTRGESFPCRPELIEARALVAD